MFRKAGQFVRGRRPSAGRANDSEGDVSSDDASGASAGSGASAAPAVEAMDISRRKSLVGHARVQRKRHRPSPGTPRRIDATQAMWYEHAKSASKLYTPSMWRVLRAVDNSSQQTQSAVLGACRKMLPRSQQHLWPGSRKTVDQKIKSRLGHFLPNVMHAVEVDLSHLGLAELQDAMVFRFIDPLFAWSCCARRLDKLDLLHFEYVEYLHPTTTERLYGASVANGNIMREACRKVPTEPGMSPTTHAHVTHNMLPTIRYPQHIHISPTIRYPQYVTHNTFTRHPQYVHHKQL